MRLEILGATLLGSAAAAALATATPAAAAVGLAAGAGLLGAGGMVCGISKTMNHTDSKTQIVRLIHIANSPEDMATCAWIGNQGKQGVDSNTTGPDGDPGEAGDDGKPGPTGDFLRVAESYKEMVQASFLDQGKEIPSAYLDTPVESGRTGDRGEKGAEGHQGPSNELGSMLGVGMTGLFGSFFSGLFTSSIVGLLIGLAVARYKSARNQAGEDPESGSPANRVELESIRALIIRVRDSDRDASRINKQNFKARMSWNQKKLDLDNEAKASQVKSQAKSESEFNKAKKELEDKIALDKLRAELAGRLLAEDVVDGKKLPKAKDPPSKEEEPLLKTEAQLLKK